MVVLNNIMVVPQKIKIELSNYLSIPLLGIYPKVLKAWSQRDVLFILSLHLRCFMSLYSFLGMILAFSDLSGSISSLFSTYCISSTVSASGLQHKQTHACPLVALSQVKEMGIEAHGGLRATLVARPWWCKGRFRGPCWRGGWFR